MVNLGDLIELENLQSQRLALRPSGQERQALQPLLVTVSKKHVPWIPKSLENPRDYGEHMSKTFLNKAGSLGQAFSVWTHPKTVHG